MGSLREIPKKLKWLYDAGMLHILSSSFFNKACTFVGNVFVVRILTKAEYGTFGYADSIMAFIINFAGLGMTSGVLQFCSEQRDEREKLAYAKFGLNFGVLSSFILSVGCLVYGAFGSFSIHGSKLVFMVYSFYPVTYFLFSYYSVVFRYRKENKKYAFLTNINAVIYAVVEIIASYFVNEFGMVVALYLSTIIASMVGMRYMKKNMNPGEFRLNREQKLGIIRYSSYSFLSYAMTNLLLVLDIFLIGTLIADPATLAVYKIAVTIPLTMMIVPNSIVVFVYPYFAEHQKEYDWLKANFKKLIGNSIMVNFLISGSLVIFAPFIISTIWGQAYMDAVTPFRILSLNYFVQGTFRLTTINIMNALNRVEVVLIANIAAVVIDLGLDLWLIPRYGMIGAAVATLSTVTITTLILLPSMAKYFLKLKRAQDR